jgi:hypothetical protein
VDSTDSGASEDGNDGLGNHGQVNGNGIALSDTHLLEDPGGPGHFPQELAICDVAAIGGVVGFVDDGDSVRVCVGVSVDAVVGSIQLALDKPSVVSVFERAAVDGLEVAGPAEKLASFAAPELVWLCDGLLVQLSVLF